MNSGYTPDTVHHSVGMTKPAELFYFFTIKNSTAFKTALRTTITPMITSVSQVIGRRSDGCDAIVNIGFSATGLKTLGVAGSLNDTLFENGQFSDAATLGDANPTQNWIKAFQGTSIHGVLLIASSSNATITQTLATITKALGTSVSVAYTLNGAVRPGSETGHERELCHIHWRICLFIVSRLRLPRRHLPACSPRLPSCASGTVAPSSRTDFDRRSGRHHDSPCVG
jgi:hypothetical protein